MATDSQLGEELILAIKQFDGAEFHVDSPRDQELIVAALTQLYRDGKHAEMKRALLLLFSKVTSARRIADLARQQIGDPFMEIARRFSK